MDEQSEYDDKTSLASHGSNTTDVDKVRPPLLHHFLAEMPRNSAIPGIGAANGVITS